MCPFPSLSMMFSCTLLRLCLFTTHYCPWTFYSTPADTPGIARANFKVIFDKLSIIYPPKYCDCANCK